MARFILVVAFFWLAACARGPAEVAAAPEPEAHDVGVSLDAEGRSKLGVDTAAIQQGSFQPTVEGAAHVVDSQDVIAPLADLAKAESDARTSQTGVARARDLFKNDTAVSAETLEAAERQNGTDDAQLRLARARATLRFGTAAPWLDARRREPLLAGLTSGSLLVVSATFPSGLGGAAADGFTVRRLGANDTERWTASDVWSGPADPTIPGATLLALVSAPTSLRIGERLSASVVTGDAVAGTVVPRSAVVLAGGEPWCYVQDGADAFVRRRIDLRQPLASGYFQRDGFAPGDRVVVAGAGLLLAREFGGGAEAD